MGFYCVVGIDNLTKEMLSCSTGDEYSLRFNNDRSECLIEFVDEFETCVAGYKKYTRSEILTIIKVTDKSDWIGEE